MERVAGKSGLALIAAFFAMFGLLKGEPALSPQASLRTIKPRPGFHVELVAAESLIESPVAFDWGPDGRLWVVEMRDYPLGMDNKGRPGGRIVILEDTDGDGRYDKSTVFLDGLLFPTGIMTWGKGVLVSCAPEIFYAEDTDGDGRADVRRPLFTGFGEANPQHRVNGLRWGLDNWVYCANGDFTAARRFDLPPSARGGSGFSSSQAEDLRRLMLAGGGIRSVQGGATHNIRNRDFRIRPDQGLLDPQSGQAQFGRDCDDWGNWFGCNNSTPIWHFVLDDHYLRRNPHATYPSPRVEAPRSVNYAIGNGRDTGSKRNSQGNPWTSACGVAVYRDDLFGSGFGNSWFTCEPVHNLVHRGVLVPSGATFTSRRAGDEEKSEFLAATDTMFSPVMVRTGPDGALWVADMYRKVLEHPHWLPPGWEKTVDVRAGHDKGRIYRVYPAGRKPRSWPRLDRLDSAGLATVLDSPNGWLRDKAQQMLVRRKDPSVVTLLEELAAKSARPLGRLHALCTLDGMSALSPEVLVQALSDPHPGVRRHAIRLTESHGTRSSDVEAALLKLMQDSDAPVRQQLAYSLGTWEGTGAARALGQLLRQDAQDPYIAAAAVSSLKGSNLATALEFVLAPPENLPLAVVENLLKTSWGLRDSPSMGLLLRYVTAPRAGQTDAMLFAGVAGWLDAVDQQKLTVEQLAKEPDAVLRSALKHLETALTKARRVVGDAQALRGDRLEAIRLLGRRPDHKKEDRAALVRFLAPQEQEAFQVAAVTALGLLREPSAAEALLHGWKAYTPALRAKVLDVILNRADGPRTLLEAMEKKQIVPQDFPLTARRRLVEHPAQELRSRAARVFTDRVDPDRDKIVVAYLTALGLKGNSARGQQIFAKHCATCHKLDGVGNVVGPDLAMVRDKPPEWFLPALFDPSRAVEARYQNYVAMTRDGKVFTGVLTEESGNQLTLIGPTGQAQVLRRTDLEALTSTGRSAMPDGLEKELKHQDTADLIAYLRRNH